MDMIVSFWNLTYVSAITAAKSTVDFRINQATLKPISRGFQTSRDLAVRRLTAEWIKARKSPFNMLLNYHTQGDIAMFTKWRYVSVGSHFRNDFKLVTISVGKWRRPAIYYWGCVADTCTISSYRKCINAFHHHYMHLSCVNTSVLAINN